MRIIVVNDVELRQAECRCGLPFYSLAALAEPASCGSPGAAINPKRLAPDPESPPRSPA